MIKERQERFIVRRRFLQESLGADEDAEYHNLGVGSSVGDEKGAEFWARQIGAKGAVEAGRNIIHSAKNAKKEQ